MPVAGADGFSKGWVVVSWDGRTASLVTCPDFTTVLQHTAGCDAVAIDMPIGLLDLSQAGGRLCEQAARTFVGGKKASSVFSSPIRAALAETLYPQALAANRAAGGIGIAKQTFCLFPKMRDIDAQITPALQKRCKEVHPEVSFAAMACISEGHAALAPKKTPLGRLERELILQAAGFTDLPRLIALGRALGAGADDVLDACAAAWTAVRVHAGTAIPLPAVPPRDSRGLEMAIWY